MGSAGKRLRRNDLYVLSGKSAWLWQLWIYGSFLWNTYRSGTAPLQTAQTDLLKKPIKRKNLCRSRNFFCGCVKVQSYLRAIVWLSTAIIFTCSMKHFNIIKRMSGRIADAFDAYRLWRLENLKCKQPLPYEYGKGTDPPLSQKHVATQISFCVPWKTWRRFKIFMWSPMLQKRVFPIC